MSHQCDRCSRRFEDDVAAALGRRCIAPSGGMLCPADAPAPAPNGAILDGLKPLPSLIAIPLQEYADTTHPVLQLHRLCDAVEILVRFCTVAVLGELRVCHADALSNDLLREIQPRIELPTLGKWKAMLDALVRRLPRQAPLVLPELPALVTDRLLSNLPGGDDQLPERCLLTLRNLLAHGGAMTRGRAEELLRDWAPRLEELVEALAFFADCTVCFLGPHAVHRLVGGTATGEPVQLAADLRLALSQNHLDGHVVLVRQGRWLDLWPLCDFGRARMPALGQPRTADRDSPLVYLRAEPQRLLYAALGVDLPHGERRDLVAAFRTLFRLHDRRPADAVASFDFEEEIRRDAAALVGRAAEIKQAKNVLKETQSGVLWVSGPGGIGKSFLLARLADDLGHAPPERQCRVAWRFKVGDSIRCTRTAFFRHAVERLAHWPRLNRADLTPAADPNVLFGQLRELLDQAAALTADDQGDGGGGAPPRPLRPPRVLFVLDGVDEIARLDPDFADVPFLLSRPNVVWLCAGRPEGRLPSVFTAKRCRHVFPASAETPAGGLGKMSADDIRGMLVDGTGALKYDLLRSEAERPGEAVAAVAARADGLPLYVRFVVEDLLAGHFTFAELERRLPPGLNAYYDDLLRRLSIGELQALLTPLVVLISWAKAPLEEETLLWLLTRHEVLVRDETANRNLLRRGLEAVQSMIKLAPVPGGGQGYEPYHFSFREHVQQDAAGIIGQENDKARKWLCNLARAWRTVPEKHPAREYALRFGPQTLVDARHSDEAAALLLDWRFLEAKTEAGWVFDLASDLATAARALAAGAVPRRRLELVEEAVRRDLHFLQRHPTTLFQCLWNSCWWYDCAEAALHYVEERVPGREEGVDLWRWLEDWRAAKEEATPGYVWLRSLRPPPMHLGTAQKAIFRGHDWAVGCLAFAPDGLQLVSGSADKTLRLWDAASGRLLRTLSGHDKEVLGVAFAPDGRLVASGSWDTTVRLWDTATGELLRTLQGHDERVMSVAFAPDGRLLASGSADQTVRLWDVTSGQEIAPLLEHEGWVTSVAFAPDGRLLASASADRSEIRLWDAATGQLLRTLDGHERDVWRVAFSPDGRLLASASSDQTVRLWDAASGRLRRTLSGHDNEVLAVGFSPDGRLLASSGWDWTVRLWDVATGALLHVFRGHEDVVGCVGFSRDGQQVASGSQDHTIRLWDVRGGQRPCYPVGHEGFGTRVRFSPDGQLLASMARDRTVRVWDAPTGLLLHTLRGHEKPVNAAAFSHDNRFLASGSADQTIHLWDMARGTLLRTFRGHADSVASVVFSPDGRLLASGSADQTVRLWDVASGQELRTLTGHDGLVGSVAFFPSGRLLVSSSRTGEEALLEALFDQRSRSVRLWDVRSGECKDLCRSRVDAEDMIRDAAAFHWRGEGDGLETVIRSAASQQPVAWFAEVVANPTTHPSTRIWTGFLNEHLFLFALEGDPQGHGTATP